MPEEPKFDHVLSTEELEALTKDLQEVLTKHGAEMGVTSTITLMRSQITSPYVESIREEAEKEEDKSTNPQAEEGSSESSGESSQS